MRDKGNHDKQVLQKITIAHLNENPGFIQAILCEIQGLFKDFSKTFLLFSRTENLRKILIYMLKFYFWNARVLV